MFLQDIYHHAFPKSLQRLLRPLLHLRLVIIQAHSYRHAAGAIISGPFAGMKFTQNYLSWPLALGTYELELHPIFEKLKNQSFSKIIDIGAAEGYYAVGCLLWKPSCSVVAYEANSHYHPFIRDLAAINNVLPRLEIRGACDKSELKALSSKLPGAFLIVDVEGYEKELLDPQEVPALRHVTILVELHDGFVPGCSEAIVERFRSSHLISTYQSRPRQACDYPIHSFVRRLWPLRSALPRSISDGRELDNGWMLLEPKNRNYS